MNLEKGMLPSLSEMNSIEEIDHSLSYKEAERETYKKFARDQEERVGIFASSDAPIITLELALMAPKDFFDEYEQDVKEFTSEIIGTISASANTVTLSNHRNDPTNQELKEKSMHIVLSEFVKLYRKKNKVNKGEYYQDILSALVLDEIIGFGPLEPLWRAENVTEIVCNGPKDVQIEIAGTIREVPSISFRDKGHLEDLINKLYGSINRNVSPTNPRVRGRLHDNSRMYAVHETVAPNGPNFNIRKHPERYWTVKDIVDKGTASAELMEDLGNLIHAGASFLVVGGTSTGKTSLLNALTGFIPSNARGLILEENLELKPHPKKLFAAPMECVPGTIMRDLVRSSLQMRPDVIIIGEISDGAAYDLCQALNTGHSGGSTVHANDYKDALERMRSLVSQEEFVRGDAVLELIGAAFDIIVVVDRMDDGSRKIVDIVELGRTPILADNEQLTLDTTPLWTFDYKTVYDDDGEVKDVTYDWIKVNTLSEYRQNKHRMDTKKRLTWEELLEISSYNIPKDMRGGTV